MNDARSLRKATLADPGPIEEFEDDTALLALDLRRREAEVKRARPRAGEPPHVALERRLALAEAWRVVAERRLASQAKTLDLLMAAARMDSVRRRSAKATGPGRGAAR